MRYEDFLIRIAASPEPGSGFEVQVLRSPAGEGHAPFQPPFPLDRAWAATTAVGRTTWRDGRHLSLGEEENGLAPERIGEELFAALFNGEVRDLYERSLGVLARDAGLGLRIKISLDPCAPFFARLQDLPWELLCRPGKRQYLGLSHRQTIVRHLSVPRTLKALPRPERLRVLLVAASPSDLPPLNLEREHKNLDKALEPIDGVEVTEVEAPTLAGLREAVRRREVHVLHFMGHGGFVKDTGVLYFEAQDGTADRVRGEDLIQKLADLPSLRLVILNACESARAGDWEQGSCDPFAGVAQSLVLSGVPAVVAMRLPVSDKASIAFSRTFYKRLAVRDLVDVAVAEGRQEMHSADRASFEWSTPVVFLRGDGDLFAKQDVSAEGSPSIKPPEIVPKKRRRRLAGCAALFAVMGLLLLFGVARWFHQQGIELAQEDRLEEAADAFSWAVRLIPFAPDFHSSLAQALTVSDPDAAEEHYRAATRWPGSWTSRHWYNLGYFLNDRGRFQEALGPLGEALEREPGFARAHNELGRACLALGQLDRAGHHLKTALSLDPEAGAPRLHLGELALTAGHPEESISFLQEALERDLVPRSQQDAELALLRAYDRTARGEEICRLIQARALVLSAEEEGIAARWNCPQRSIER